MYRRILDNKDNNNNNKKKYNAYSLFLILILLILSEDLLQIIKNQLLKAKKKPDHTSKKGYNMLPVLGKRGNLETNKEPKEDT